MAAPISKACRLNDCCGYFAKLMYNWLVHALVTVAPNSPCTNTIVRPTKAMDTTATHCRFLTASHLVSCRGPTSLKGKGANYVHIDDTMPLAL